MANYSALRELILEKEASILPEFLAKPSRDGFIDPRHDDFSKNQAFGRGVGVGLLPAALGAGVAVGGRRALGAGIAGAGALAGLGTYRHRLQQFRDLQAQGRNPVTGRMHDPERIERTRRYVERMRSGKRGAQEALNQQVLEDLRPKTASYAEAKKEAGLQAGFLERNKKSRYERDMRSPDAALGRMLKARLGRAMPTSLNKSASITRDDLRAAAGAGAGAGLAIVGGRKVTPYLLRKNIGGPLEGLITFGGPIAGGALGAYLASRRGGESERAQRGRAIGGGLGSVQGTAMVLPVGLLAMGGLLPDRAIPATIVAGAALGGLGSGQWVKGS